MTTSLYDFTTTLSASNDYQMVVMAWLREERGAVVEDMRGTDADIKQGIDLTINDEAAQFKADDKIDSTGNIAFELISNLGKGTLGCGVKREARWWLYYGTVSSTLHVIDHHKLIDQINVAGETSWRGFTTHTGGWNRQAAYATVGMLIPIAAIKKMLGRAYACFSLAKFIKSRGGEKGNL